MLYVFLVDTGTMLTFDMNLAMESVKHLQSVIAKMCKISEDKQVLLISGGESLDPTVRVCAYSAGTDTNPIFLFSKTTIESSNPPSASVDVGSDTDLRDQVEGSLNMPATYSTVVVRVQLAQQFHDLAREQVQLCERLVHDQHLQQQGWAAVVANLEDISSAFKSRASLFKSSYKSYLESRSSYLEILNCFSDSLLLLSKIPLLSCLLENAGEHIVDSGVCSDKEQLPSLLEWISAKGSQQSLDQIAEHCRKGLEQFNEEVLESGEEEINKVLELADTPSMKEVKGLGDRLFGLEQLMQDARKIVQEQAELAQSFVKNQERAGAIRDKSILPDLCNSHRKQLQVMLKSHQHLRDIRRRCTLAKEELSVNLHHRLRWIMYVEKSMCDADSKLIIYHESLKRLRRHLEVMKQVYSTPQIYATALVEVVRRRQFSDEFLRWSSRLAESSREAHSEEMVQREEFNGRMLGHFLLALFPGLDSYPPPFAMEAPGPFDDKLPCVNREDIESLRERVPELADILSVPDVETVAMKLSSRQVLGPSSTTLCQTLSKTTTNSDGALIRMKQQEKLSPSRLANSEPIIPHDVRQNYEKQNRVDSLVTLCSRAMNSLPINDDMPVQRLESDVAAHELKRETIEASASVNFHLSDSQSLATPSASEKDNKVDADGEELITLTTSSVVPIVDDLDIEIVMSEKETDVSSKVEASDNATNLVTSPTPCSQSNQDASPSSDICPLPIDTSPEFVTADFYMDESMPSSYTDSNGQPVAKPQNKYHEVLNELQRQMLEKDQELYATHEKLSLCQNQLSNSQSKLDKLLGMEVENTVKLKAELYSLRNFVVEIKQEAAVAMQNESDAVKNFLGKFDEYSEQVKAAALATAMNKLTAEHEEVVAQLEHKVEVASTALYDSQKEVDNLHQKIVELTEKMESLREEYENEKMELEKDFKDQKEQYVKEILIEHELELDSLRSEYSKTLSDKEDEINDLNHTISELQKQLINMAMEKEQMNGTYHEQFQEEKDRLRKILETDYKRREDEVRKEVKETLQKNHLEELEEQKRNLQTEGEETVSKVRDELQTLHSENLEQLRGIHEVKQAQALKEQQTKLEEEKRTALEEQKERLRENFRSELENTRSRLRLAYRSQTELGSSPDSFDDGEQTHTILSHLRADFIAEKDNAIREALEEQKAEHDENVEKLKTQLEKEKNEAVVSAKSNTMAERQMQFNEVVAKVAAEKELVINRLKQREAELLAEQDKNQALIQKLMSGKMDVIEGQEVPSASAASTSTAGDIGDSTMVLNEQEKICELEESLRSKDEQLAKLQKRIMELSMSASTSASMFHGDKVSFLTCSVGDTVLLCYDERHEHYVVFNIGPVMYFLHSDCLDILGLKPAPGESRKSWVLAEITDKEYCQAKKQQNRFKVPVGTKFYRVRVKPWNKEAALARSHFYAS